MEEAVDLGKTLDSIQREYLYPPSISMVKAYGILQQIVLVTKSFYNNFKSRVGKSESSSGVKTYVGVVL